MLRIIAGELGGRRLRTPSGLRTRPTSERVREALFSILESSGVTLVGRAVLDLYAGSGALGIEALSRGAERAFFVEQDAVAGRTLLSNLREMGMASRAQLVSRPVRSSLSQLAAQGPFHVIFADPPYASAELPWLLETIATSAALSVDGCLVVERASRDADVLEREAATASSPKPSQLTLHDRRRYGDTSLLFYRPVGGAS